MCLKGEGDRCWKPDLGFISLSLQRDKGAGKLWIRRRDLGWRTRWDVLCCDL